MEENLHPWEIWDQQHGSYGDDDDDEEDQRKWRVVGVLAQDKRITFNRRIIPVDFVARDQDDLLMAFTRSAPRLHPPKPISAPEAMRIMGGETKPYHTYQSVDPDLIDIENEAVFQDENGDFYVGHYEHLDRDRKYMVKTR